MYITLMHANLLLCRSASDYKYEKDMAAINGTGRYTESVLTCPLG